MNPDQKLFQCSRCQQGLTVHRYVVCNRKLRSGELVCPDCGRATPVLRGMVMFTETAEVIRGEQALQELDKSLFGTRHDYRQFIRQQIQRPVYDSYAAYTPFNGALVGFLRFRNLVAGVLKPGDVILDLGNRTGWTGEFMASLFPAQKVVSGWYGDRGGLGYRGYGYWLGDEQRLPNLDCLFLGDMGDIPITTGSIGLVYGYDHLHHHAARDELEELLRITHPDGIIYFSHLHTSNSRPDPYFERGGTLMTSDEWIARLEGLDGIGQRVPFLLGELNCYRDGVVTLESRPVIHEYNCALLIGPGNWEGLEVPSPANQVPGDEAMLLQNPLLDVDLATGSVHPDPENMEGGAGYVLSRHPAVARRLEELNHEALTELQRLVLYRAAKGLSWGEIRQKLSAPVDEADRAVCDLINRQLVLALPISPAMWQLQNFYNRRRLVQPPSEQNFASLWQELEHKYGDAPVLLDSDGSEFDIANTRLLVAATVCLLNQHGSGKGDNVLILSAGHVEAFFVTWASWLVGAVVVVLNPGMDETWLKHTISDFGIALAFADDEDGAGLISGCEVIVFDDMQSRSSEVPSFSESIEPYLDQTACIDETVSGQDSALVVATSGSTGAPKLATLDQGSLFRSGEVLSDTYKWQQGERLLSLGPFYSISGLRNPGVAALHSGTTIVHASPLQRSSFPSALKCIEESKVNIVTTVPAFVENLATFVERGDLLALPALRMILSTASKLDAGYRARLFESLEAEILDYYGLSETCGICIAQVPGSAPRGNSIGQVVNAIVTIRSTEGEEAPLGEAGELHIYTDNMMTGYIGEPEAGLPIVDGWLATGDQARIESDGEIILLGRLDGATKNRQGEFVLPDKT